MNTEVADLIGLEPISTIVSKLRTSLFGHVVRLAADTPANRALSLGQARARRHLKGDLRCLGRPRGNWLKQIKS